MRRNAKRNAKKRKRCADSSTTKLNLVQITKKMMTARPSKSTWTTMRRKTMVVMTTLKALLTELRLKVMPRKSRQEMKLLTKPTKGRWLKMRRLKPSKL